VALELAVVLETNEKRAMLLNQTVESFPHLLGGECGLPRSPEPRDVDEQGVDALEAVVPFLAQLVAEVLSLDGFTGVPDG
jgi:hypothetical protein